MYVSHYWAWLICPQRSRSQDDGQLCALSLWHTLVRIEEQHSKHNAKGSANESETRIDSLERFERLTHAVLFRKQRPRNATNSNSFCLVLRFFFRFCFWVFRMHVALFESKFPDILCNWILSRGAQQSLRVWSATSARISIFIFAAFSCFLVSWALFMSHKKPKTNPRDTFPIPKTPALSRGRWKWRTACNLCQIW